MGWPTRLLPSFRQSRRPVFFLGTTEGPKANGPERNDMKHPPSSNKHFPWRSIEVAAIRKLKNLPKLGRGDATIVYLIYLRHLPREHIQKPAWIYCPNQTLITQLGLSAERIARARWLLIQADLIKVGERMEDRNEKGRKVYRPIIEMLCEGEENKR